MEEVKPTVIRNVQRIFMHEKGRYTALVKNSNTNKIGRLAIVIYNDLNLMMFEDVPENEQIWIEYYCGYPDYNCKEIPANFSFWKIYPEKVIMHLHSAKEINGAGWNHGKYGRGQSVVIE